MIIDSIDRVTEHGRQRNYEVASNDMLRYVRSALYTVQQDLDRAIWQQALESAKSWPRDTEDKRRTRALRLLEAQLHLFWHEPTVPEDSVGASYWIKLSGDY